MVKESNKLTSQILDFLLRTPHCFAFRCNTVGIPLASGGMRSTSKRGISDIIACYRGFAIFIEVKTGTDTIRSEQISFRASVNASGGVYVIASDYESVISDLNAIFDKIDKVS